MSWTTLDLNNLLAGEPLIESEVLALYENPSAIIKSAPGAPRPVTLDSYFARGGSNLLSGLGPGGLALPSAAFTGGFSDATASDGTYVSAGTLNITARATGTIRFTSNGTGTSTGQRRLLRNGTEVANFNGNGIFSADVGVVAGDVMEWQVRRASGSTVSNLTGFAQTADDTVENFGLWAKRSEVV